MINDSNFLAEDESVISTNIIRKEEIGDQSINPDPSIRILSTQNEDRTNTLVQDKPNSAPATQLTSNQLPSAVSQKTFNWSPSPVNQSTANQSPAATTKCTVDQSPASVVTRLTSNHLSKSTPLPTVTLPKNTNKWRQRSMIKEKRKIKWSILRPARTTLTRKRAVSQKTNAKQRRKKPTRPRNRNGR